MKTKMKHFARLLLAGLLLGGGGSVVQASPLQNGLQAYYQFDANGNDSSGNGLNLDLFGGVGFATGIFGQALDLHANASQYAQRPFSDPVFDFGANDFTIQIWVNFNSVTSAEQTIFEKASEFGAPGWTISKITRSGLDGVELYATGIGPIDSPALTITSGAWHQLIARRQGVTFDFFYDDLLVASAISSVAITPSPNSLLVGKRNPDDPRGGFPVDGRLDEIAVWSRSLSNKEISALYNSGNGTAIDLSSAPIPEPTMMVLLCAGLAGLAGFRTGRK
jgi:hypothetical protein